MDKKEIPEEQINPTKAAIAEMEKAIAGIKQQKMMQQAAQMAVQQGQQQMGEIPSEIPQEGLAEGQ